MSPNTLPASLQIHPRVSIKEVAAGLGFSVQHTRRLIKEGKIPPPTVIGRRKFSWPMEVLIALTSKKEVA